MASAGALALVSAEAFLQTLAGLLVLVSVPAMAVVSELVSGALLAVVSELVSGAVLALASESALPSALLPLGFPPEPQTHW